MTFVQRALIVDHDLTSSFLTTRIIRRTGVAANVLVATTGQQALDLLAKTPLMPPELLFVGWRRPFGTEMPLLTFIEEFQRHYSQYSAIIVILAVSITPSDLHALRRTHAGPIFDKPLTEEDVHQLMRDYHLQAVPKHKELAM